LFLSDTQGTIGPMKISKKSKRRQGKGREGGKTEERIGTEEKGGECEKENEGNGE
jgi:hypothetical protein